MITEEDKQISEVFKIAGFGFMSPFGKVVLDMPGFTFYPINFMYLIFVCISLLSFYMGIIVVAKSIDTVTERKIKR